MSVAEAVRIISTYSADTFGVCSALFELGGMVVIHDPSGCNSTYTTHDEPRWYDTDSLIFISGLTEMDAVMGNDDKFVADVVQTAKELSPAFIVLLCTPVPLMMGTDMPALAAVMESETGIPVYTAPTNSMKTYDLGISWALELLARKMVPDRAPKTFCCSWNPVLASCGSARAGKEKTPVRANIIGMTPLDFAVNGSERSAADVLRADGIEVISTWAMGSTLTQIGRAGQADVNLVISWSGLAAAQVLQQRFGTPYVVGVPIGDFLQQEITHRMREAAVKKQPYYIGREYRGIGKPDVAIIGESVYSTSLAAALTHACGYGVQVLCPLHAAEDILAPQDLCLSGEETIHHAAAASRIVIADPLYQPIFPPPVRFVPLGHEGFSGRLYEKKIPNLIDHFDDFAAMVRGDEDHGHE